MANIEAQIKPTGMSQRNLVDLLYMVVSSIQGICKKLDLSNLTDITYESLCYTAIFNGSIEDVRGNTIMNRVAAKDHRFFIITPNGITPKALTECLYQIFDMMKTMTEQIDDDAAPPSSVTYEALCYEALYLWNIVNVDSVDGSSGVLGNGTEYYFKPGATGNRKELVNLLYAIVKSIETLTKKLDTDALPSGTDYEALWFTATILMRIENSTGDVVGNDTTIEP